MYARPLGPVRSTYRTTSMFARHCEGRGSIRASSMEIVLIRLPNDFELPGDDPIEDSLGPGLSRLYSHSVTSLVRTRVTRRRTIL